jgi:hypothetical protein
MEQRSQSLNVTSIEQRHRFVEVWVRVEGRDDVAKLYEVLKLRPAFEAIFASNDKLGIGKLKRMRVSYIS